MWTRVRRLGGLLGCKSRPVGTARRNSDVGGVDYLYPVLLAESFLERNTTTVTLIATLTVGIVGWWLLWFFRAKDKETKHLDYRVIDDLPIFSSRHRPPRLKVAYMDQPVKDPRVTRIMFRNTGKQVIDPDDFLEPLVIRRGTAKLLDHNVIDHKNLADLRQTLGSQFLAVDARTLNSGDHFTVQVLYDGGEDEPVTVSCRIRNQTRDSDTMLLPQEKATLRTGIVVSLVFAAICLALGGGIFISLHGVARYVLGLGALALFGALGLGLLVAALALRRRMYRNLREGKPPITRPDD